MAIFRNGEDMRIVPVFSKPSFSVWMKILVFIILTFATPYLSATAATLSPPILVSPGTGSAPGPSVSTTTPIFQWQSVSGADGYALYISKYNGSSYDLIFDSSVIGGPITNTSYILPSGYLVNGGQYRWNMASHNSSGYGTPNASRMYFTVSIVSTLPAPNLVSPGTGSAPGPSVSTTTPTFQWNSVSNADLYGLYISEYPYGDNNIVYQNEGISGASTSLTLPSGHLINGERYRWNMRAHNSGGWSSYSDRLYFTVSLPSTSAEFGGTVTDENTGSAISGASVVWGSYTKTTDGSGNYRFDSVPCQTNTLTVSKAGYQTLPQN